ncbi:MAG TPA: glycoside hydrolase family 3 N-terminal domain-containing protein [Polyangia bacterium]
MASNVLRIATLVVLATAAACGSSSSVNPGGTGGVSPWGGQGGDAGAGGDTSGTGGWPGPQVTGGPWIPSQACFDQASALAAMLTPAQFFGQMTQVDSAGLTVTEATSALLGSVLSGGSSDPASGNKISDWSALVSSYLNIASTFSPHIGLLYGIDAVHGNNNVVNAVIFPHDIGIGATGNPDIARQEGRITALEMLGVGMNWAFAPTVAAARDERWGRTDESFGESPTLTSQMGAAMVDGLQNGGLGSAQSVLGCAKHYAGDGLTDGGKNAGNVTAYDDATFRQLAIEPYRASIAGGVGSIMVSYSSYQGTKMTASKPWLTDVLKGELGFQGILLSDWDAVSQLPGSWSQQVKAAINAGLDMVMLSHSSGAHRAADLANTLNALVNSGDIPVSRIRDAVHRILTVKCEMGLLDGDTTIDPTLTAAIGSAEHRAVARDAVRQSLVVLKNDGMLPLSKTVSRLHVTGSGADSLVKQCGGWTIGWQGLGTAGAATATTTGTTVLAAIKNALGSGTTTVTTSADGSGAAGADRAIVVVGEAPYAEGMGDSTNPTLTAADFATIAAVKASGVPFVVVLFSGRPLLLTDSKGVSALDSANAFIAAWLPGSEGDGVADVLFGDYKPTGKLSFTWPASLAQLPIHDGDGQTPLFPLGYGLTYP